MRYHDFRGFISLLATEGELVEVETPLVLPPQADAPPQAASAPDGPAILFRHVVGHEGRLITGVYAAPRRVALALGMPREAPPRAILDEYARRWDRYPLEPNVLAPSAAPCKQVVLRGAAADLSRLPIPRWSPSADGLFIDQGVVICRDHETGALHLGLARLEVIGPRELRIHATRGDDQAAHLARALHAGAALDVAVIIGNDPAVTLSAASEAPEARDQYALAGALKGCALVITECEGSDLEVPAHSEIVVECHLAGRPSPRGAAAPVDEDAERSPARQQATVLAVHTITHRRDPIFEAPWAGSDAAGGDLAIRLLRTARGSLAAAQDE